MFTRCTQLPLVGAIQCFCVEQPRVDIEFSGATVLTKFPGLVHAIQGLVDSILASVIVLPNRCMYTMVGPEQIQRGLISSVELSA